MIRTKFGFFAAVIAVIMMFSVCVFAEGESIVVGEVVFEEYINSVGEVEENLVKVKVNFTAPTDAEQILIYLAGEDISEISDATKDKIIFMYQPVDASSGVYEFTVEKSRIAIATGTSDIEGVTLYVKMGAKNVASMTTKPVIYSEPSSSVVYGDVNGDGVADMGDAVQILRYEAGLADFTDEQIFAGDVTGDGETDIGDAIRILRYDAGLISSLR